MKRLLIIIVSIIVLSLSWSKSNLFATPNESSDSSTASNAFTIDLFKKIVAIEEYKDKNIFFSPYNIFTALTMCYAGAKGSTAKEIATALHLTQSGEDVHRAFYNLTDRIKKSSKEGSQLLVGNAIWSQKGREVRQDFLNLIKKYYEGEFYETDFKSDPQMSKMAINNWIFKKTRGKIQEAIKDIEERTNLILTTAIYFKGDWVYKFDSTQKKPFYIEPKKSVDVEMMQIKQQEFLKKRFFLYGEPNKDLQILELPYKGEEFSMVILLPSMDKGLKSIEDAISLEMLNKWLSELRNELVEIYLPKFKFNTNYELQEILKKMGVNKVFTQYQADFSGIFKQSNREYLENVIHKAYIEVHEKGTEAVAITTTNMISTSLIPPKFKIYSFIADHPFIFLIRHKPTNTILFMGKVINPESE